MIMNEKGFCQMLMN